MKPTRILIAALLALVLCTPALAQQKATLNLVSAGDQNMVDYVKDYLAPMFEKEHPGVTVRAVGQFSEDFEPSGGLFGARLSIAAGRARAAPRARLSRRLQLHLYAAVVCGWCRRIIKRSAPRRA